MPCRRFRRMEDFETEQPRLVRVTLRVDKARSTMPKGVGPLGLDIKRSVGRDMGIAVLFPTHKRELQSVEDSKGPTARKSISDEAQTPLQSRSYETLEDPTRCSPYDAKPQYFVEIMPTLLENVQPEVGFRSVPFTVPDDSKIRVYWSSPRVSSGFENVPIICNKSEPQRANHFTRKTQVSQRHSQGDGSESRTIGGNADRKQVRHHLTMICAPLSIEHVHLRR
ncbi:hypothetical protein IFM46972_04496 [Aspergillus udagawae]|uniref:Uncharacterized protein n=1 Tax=Aspergillus udagawae TaxID=91492 RepID=A0A8H3NK54_9EURO|nr:hypothetical protein IFM46972_04496 [Aspergillus udagawae]